MESGIGSGFGLGQTEPVGDAAGAQNRSSSRARERSEDREPRWRRKEPQKHPENASVEETPRTDIAEGGAEGSGEGMEDAGKDNQDKEGAGEDENERPPHRVDSLA